MDAVMHQLTLITGSGRDAVGPRFIFGNIPGSDRKKTPGAQTRSLHRALRHTLTPSPNWLALRRSGPIARIPKNPRRCDRSMTRRNPTAGSKTLGRPPPVRRETPFGARRPRFDLPDCRNFEKPLLPVPSSRSPCASVRLRRPILPRSDPGRAFALTRRLRRPLALTKASQTNSILARQNHVQPQESWG